MHTINIDIETFSSENLKKSGAARYFASPDFTILLLSYSINKGPVILLDLTTPEGVENFHTNVAPLILSALYLKIAYNAAFEIGGLSVYMGVELDPSQWRCTMVRAGRLGWPMYLEGVAEAMALGEQKDKGGKALIKYFSEPCKPTKVNGMRTRNMPWHAPDKWASYGAYNMQDVVTEIAVDKRVEFAPVPEFEDKLWALDQIINRRGVMVDMQLVNNALKLDALYKEKVMTEAVQLTGLDNPNSAAQLKEWLSDETGGEVTKLRKEDLPELISANADNDTVLRVLELRKELAKTSVKKYIAMAAAVLENSRICGLLQFGGANRTMRWAGRLVQVQNLPGITLPDTVLDYARRLLRAGDFKAMQEMAWFFGSVPDVLSQLIRTAFIAPENHVLGVYDFSAIEARIIAWLTGEKWRIEVFATHGKIYEASAARMFKIALEDITKDSPYRKKGKVSELALGYQGSVDALIRMGALSMGIVEDELPDMVAKWRSENQNIVNGWKSAQAAAVDAIRNPGEKFHAVKCIFFSEKGYLFIQLPSGRRLSYVSPGIETTMVVKVKMLKDSGKYKEGAEIYVTVKQAHTLAQAGIIKVEGEPFERHSIFYYGIDQTNKKWCKQYTYGGKLIENITQAIARDCLAVAMMRCSKAGHTIVMHVHDEIVFELLKVWAEQAMASIKKIMEMPIEWAKGLLLKAEGFTSNYYKKD